MTDEWMMLTEITSGHDLQLFRAVFTGENVEFREEAKVEPTGGWAATGHLAPYVRIWVQQLDWSRATSLLKDIAQSVPVDPEKI